MELNKEIETTNFKDNAIKIISNYDGKVYTKSNLIKDNLKKGSILTDTGSAKKEVNKIIKNISLDNIHWIASHPIAGTEYSGPEAGFSELFKNRWCILSTDKEVSKSKISKLEEFWIKLGSKTKFMSFEDHDYVLSLTSHLPHAVAYCMR